MLNRPKIICHMLMSIDGKVTGDFLSSKEALQGSEYYYELNRESNSSFLCGRVTMEENFTKGFFPNLEDFKNCDVPEGDFITYERGSYFAIALDRYGHLGWKENKIIDDDPGYNDKQIIEVLTKKAPKEYLAYLRSINLSYIICGDDELDLKLALKKLLHSFGINKIYLEGGSITNGVFNRLNLIDELSLVMVPVIANKDSKSLFDSSIIEKYQLEKVETKKDIVCLKYYSLKESTYSVNFCNNDLNTILKQTKNLFKSCDELSISYNKAIEILNPNLKIINYQKLKKSSSAFSYLNCEKELINPVFLNYLPTILNIKEDILKNILSRKLVAILDKITGTINFVKTHYLEKFSDERYYILTIIEFIKNQLKTIDINNPKSIEQQNLFNIFKENKMNLNDIFIDKIIVHPHINEALINKKEDNYLITLSFLKVLLRCERLTKIKEQNAPNLIVEFETTLLQESLNNYYFEIYESFN